MIMLDEVLGVYAHHHHADIRKPRVPPNGWAELAPLLSARLYFEISRESIAGAMNSSPQYVGQVERGGQRVSDRFIARYRAALEELLMDEVENGSGLFPALEVPTEAVGRKP